MQCLAILYHTNNYLSICHMCVRKQKHVFIAWAALRFLLYWSCVFLTFAIFVHIFEHIWDNFILGNSILGSSLVRFNFSLAVLLFSYLIRFYWDIFCIESWRTVVLWQNEPPSHFKPPFCSSGAFATSTRISHDHHFVRTQKFFSIVALYFLFFRSKSRMLDLCVFNVPFSIHTFLWLFSLPSLLLRESQFFPQGRCL